MFHSARITLTAWYLLIIMVISLLFSVATYTRINTELMHLEELNAHIQERQRKFLRVLPSTILPEEIPPRFDPNAIQAARVRLVTALAILNGAVFLIAGGGGYFLAGRTLRPIKKMMDDQKRFISDASHELKTPLTALRSEIEVNLRDRNLSLPDAKKLLKSNLEEVIHLQQLSEGLLALSKNEVLEKNAFTHQSLMSLIEPAVRKVTPLAKKKQIVIQQEITDVSLRVKNGSLTELFVILLDNAIKYSPKKSVIVLRSKSTHTSVRISVIDQGIGIAKKDIVHIFDRFYRADEARTKDNTGGYGIGLSIARKIVEDHNGEISVRSKIGKGSEFTVVLPRS